MPDWLDLLRPARVTSPATHADDPRLGHLFGRDVARTEAARAALVGFPVDEGVRRNGGRAGAAAGPEALRQALYRLTPDPRDPAFAALAARTVDLGDVDLGDVDLGDADLGDADLGDAGSGGAMEAAQERLGTVVGALLAAGVVPVVLGGGHETTYGHFLGYVAAGRRVRLVNLDAHADVRPLRHGQGHSGSPFRQALEHPAGLAAGYAVAGLQPHATAAAHLAFLAQHGAAHTWADDLDAATLDTLYAGPEATLASFDLDAVEAAAAPGVSAPSPRGLAVAPWLAAAYRAGRSPAVASADVVELNPAFDRDGQTARLAALTVWHFLRGLAARSAPKT